MTTYSTRTWSSIVYEFDRTLFEPDESYRFKGRAFYNPKPLTEYLTTDGTPYYTDDGTPYYVTD